MKKQASFWTVSPIVIPAEALAIVAVIGLWFVHPVAFYIGLVALLALIAATVWYFVRMHRSVRWYLEQVAAQLDPSRRTALQTVPFPVLLCSHTGEILWYNKRFEDEVADEQEWLGESVRLATGGYDLADLRRRERWEIVVGDKQYTLLLRPVTDREDSPFVLYYDENTRLKETEREYRQSRPVVLVIYIDNLEELLQNKRDSDRARAASRVESTLEDWFSDDKVGLLRKYEQGRFIILTEHRRLEKMAAEKFRILDTVRTLDVDGQSGFTLSIGVGEGAHPGEAEANARQALEMALGRGGDQAAVKHENGFDFYGGVSRGVEKRTKVRSRIVASALLKLMRQSDRVLLMGHRFSDVDCLGAALALTEVARVIGKEAFTVVNRDTSLAGELIKRYDREGKNDRLISPDKAAELLTDNTLLIITDTHTPAMLESKELYERAGNVVVVDHHRKMVDHIENAVIFYHETYASSASEMVTELIQAMEGIRPSALEAEALLAGIMLDTRDFVMKVGGRTFEAAATLRNWGADPVAVKRLFAGNMATYRAKAELVAAAEQYRNTVIAYHEGGGTDVRIAAAQAANELLSVQGTDASFTLFSEGEDVNISARSMGNFNVQLVMEDLGGGGHMTMAGARLCGVTGEEAKRRLIEAIDRRLETTESNERPDGAEDLS